MKSSNLVFAAALLGACGPGESVQIRWTDHGIPHIEADNFNSLGYGMGYAMARDHGCVYADQLVKVRSERSKYFGAGEDDVNIESDFGWYGLRVKEDAQTFFTQLPEDRQALLSGYAAGYSRAVADGDIPSQCRDEDWVFAIDGVDVLTYIFALGQEGSGKNFTGFIASASPPEVASAAPDPNGLRKAYDQINDPSRGSNGWAIGRDRAADGTDSLLLSNTHFPAVGERQWHESHITIPGVVDAYGVSLVGVPAINMGFTEAAAWTHTVSYSPRFTVYILEIDPEDPTSYIYDGESRKMTSSKYTVEVKGEGGELSQRKRTLYRTHFGPMLNLGLGWTRTNGLSYRDVNEQNLEMLEVWLGMNVATSKDEFLRAHDETQGIPWVYTIAAFPDGDAFFGDTSRVPYLDDELQEKRRQFTEENSLASLLNSQVSGIIFLDGSDSSFEWVEDDESVIGGLVPPRLAPTDLRGDYVFNANDSHWLHNAEEPLEGELEVFGPERTPRSSRTRMNARYLSEQTPEGAAGEDGKFTLEEVEAAALGMRSVLAEEALAGVVARCTGVTDVVLSEGLTIDISEACNVLSEWDGTYTTDAVGAIVWREMLAAGEFDVGSIPSTGGDFFSVPFDPSLPVATPSTLADPPEVATGEDGSTTDPVLRSLAIAITTLAQADLNPSSTLGEAQYLTFSDGSTIPVGGGTYWEGLIGIADYSGGATTSLMDRYVRGNVINSTSELTEDGYPMNNGNSWIMAFAFEDGVPRGRAIMTYAQSDDPESPYFQDQSEIYSEGKMRPIYFTEEEIAEHVVEELSLDPTADDSVVE